MQAVHVRHVGLDEDGAVAAGRGVETLGGLLPHSLIEVGDHDVGPFFHEVARDALAEALGGAGDDDGLAINASLGCGGTYFAAVVLHLPVVDEFDLALCHRMLPAETLGVPCDFDRINEDICDDLCVLCAVAGCQKPYSLDEYDFRGVAAPCDVLLDLLLGQFCDVLAFRGLDEDVFRLAVDDAVRSEWREHALRLLHHRYEQG